MNKILNTRICLKVSTENEWTQETSTSQKNKTNANYVLQRGEIGFVEIPASNSSDTPRYTFKVGDGVHQFKDLDLVYANSEDVPDWAKTDSTSFINWLDEYFVLKENGEYKELLTNAVLNVTTTTDGGLKVERNENTVNIDIDDALTFILSCGNADIDAVNTVILKDNGSGQTAYV